MHKRGALQQRRATQEATQVHWDRHLESQEQGDMAYM